MSRIIANKGFKELCKAIKFQIADLQYMTGSSRVAIFLYAANRRACPRLEIKLAKIFKLTVPALRKRLGLKATSNRRKS